MKARWKILIAVVAAGFYWYLINYSPIRPAEVDTRMMTTQDLQEYYQDTNYAYFENQLPKDVTIDFLNTDPKAMASTSFESGKFRISFNRGYRTGNRYMKLSMLHEECHIKTWGEFDQHGPEWRACMNYLDIQGAFRRELIDQE